MCNDQGEEVNVSGLGADIVPVFSTHSQWAPLAEAWQNSAVWKVKICEIWLVSGRVGSGSLGYRLVISCTMSRVTGTGGALRASVASVCSALNLVPPWTVDATSHSALTMAQSAGHSSVQKSSRRVSRKPAQLASDAFSAGLPKKNQLLRRRTFHAGTDVGEQGPWCMMTRTIACCACSKANLSLAGGCTNVGAP